MNGIIGEGREALRVKNEALLLTINNFNSPFVNMKNRF